MCTISVDDCIIIIIILNLVLQHTFFNEKLKSVWASNMSLSLDFQSKEVIFQSFRMLQIVELLKSLNYGWETSNVELYSVKIQKMLP